MANPKQLKLLRQDVEAWNGWRTENPELMPNLKKADLSNTHVGIAQLQTANLSGADLSEANLSGANLSRSDLRGANLRHANLRHASLISAKLSDAHLNSADLSEADLTRADLRNADLSNADLSDANLMGAYLIGANLSRSDLDKAHLDSADLSKAELVGAYLMGANLYEANLSEAHLTRAILGSTVFGNTNLANASGLVACIHERPSVLDYSTLAQSGPLPLPFLRGCGLPDIFIEYLPSLLNQGIQFHSCFISYSTRDQEFADRLYANLQNKGVRCWFAPHDIQGGKKLHEQIDAAIQMHDRLLLLLSEASMNSEWVKTEIAKARARETREKRRMLFPVSLVDFEAVLQWECFDADTGKDSAREIREYYIPDFSKWKDHDCYQRSFERLIKDLKAEEKLR